jgi:hypothetical protein
MNTKDEADSNLPVEKQINLIWAFGFPNWQYHGSSNRGNTSILMSQTVNFDNGVLAKYSYIFIVLVTSSYIIGV